jgi:hypothetical protein
VSDPASRTRILGFVGAEASREARRSPDAPPVR